MDAPIWCVIVGQSVGTEFLQNMPMAMVCHIYCFCLCRSGRPFWSAP